MAKRLSAPMKVLATRRFVGPAWDELDEVAIGSLDEAHSDVEALLVANERVDGAVLDLFPKLRIVANFGVGYDQIDVDGCRRRGIVVTNTPGVLTDATADLTLALILAVRRRLGAGERIVRGRVWTWTWSRGFLADEVAGSTLGIVGFGRIGSAVARRAEGFDMRILSVGSAGTDEQL